MRLPSPSNRSPTLENATVRNDIAQFSVFTCGPAIWKQKLEDLASEPAQNWASAPRALRLINDQVPVDDLFAERFPNFDHVFGPELDQACTWKRIVSEVRQ